MYSEPTSQLYNRHAKQVYLLQISFGITEAKIINLMWSLPKVGFSFFLYINLYLLHISFKKTLSDKPLQINTMTGFLVCYVFVMLPGLQMLPVCPQ